MVLVTAMATGALPLAGSAAVEISRSNPVGGATLPVLPQNVEIWSAEPADPAYTQVIVVAPNGARIDSGQPEIDADDSTHLSVAIASGGRAGRYTVHLLSGEPNTARERSASTVFEVESDSGCEESSDHGCADTLPEVESGDEFALPGGGTIQVTTSTNTAGPVTIEVRLLGADGGVAEGARVWVRASHLDMDHGEFPHAAVLNDDGVFLASYIGMGMEGAWRLTVDVILDEGSAPFTVAVPVQMSLPGS
jgi:methionine-rich copper-binding protein CopC